MRRVLYLAVLTLSLVSCTCKRKPLQIIFTNDSHSQVEAKNGFGGFEARAALFDSLRTENPNVLIVDAGDMWQGSPYFNMFKGRLETEAYNKMGYMAVTLGNHEFDNGLDTLAARIDEMNFPVVCANYIFDGTVLENRVKPYTIVEQHGWRIGIIGVSVNPESLIVNANIEGIVYIDPIAAVNKYSAYLRHEQHCNLIIVLSHLGIFDDGVLENVDDNTLAESVSGVDLILGGHSHNHHGVFDFTDIDGKKVTVLQEEKSGLKVYSITVL